MTRIGIDTSVLIGLLDPRDIPFIASFDHDFDSLEWLQRVAQPEDLVSSGL